MQSKKCKAKSKTQFEPESDSLVLLFALHNAKQKAKSAKQKVRLNSNQKAIQPLANICWNLISAHATILIRSLKS